MSPELAASMQNAESLLKGRDPEGALRTLAPALAARPALPRAHMIAAMAKLRQGRPGEAVGHLDIAAAILDRAAAAPAAFLALAGHYSAARAFDKALEMLRKGRSRFPESAELAVAEGDLFERLGRHGDAITAYRAATAMAPDSAEAWSSLAIALHKSGETAAAIDGYRQALGHGGRSGGIYNESHRGADRDRHPGEALATAEAWLAAMPGSIEALSFKALLLTETGKRDEAEKLIDFERFMRVETIAVPPGYASLEAFNRALEAAVLAHPKLATPPEDHPTWHHPALRDRQSQARRRRGAARRSPSRSCAARSSIILPRQSRATAIPSWPTDRARSRSPPGPPCSTGRATSSRMFISMAICRAATTSPSRRRSRPTTMAATGRGPVASRLGRPPQELGLKARFPSRTIKPQEGMMVLFPAYLYHATVPFNSRQRRISIAFDVLPEAGRPKRAI